MGLAPFMPKMKFDGLEVFSISDSIHDDLDSESWSGGFRTCLLQDNFHPAETFVTYLSTPD